MATVKYFVIKKHMGYNLEFDRIEGLGDKITMFWKVQQWYVRLSASIYTHRHLLKKRNTVERKHATSVDMFMSSENEYLVSIQ